MRDIEATELQSIISKAGTLVEALPYMQRLAGKTIVVKYGGNAMIDEILKNHVVEDIALLKQIGINPILVHGGGPDINAMLSRLGVQSEFRGGLRVTDAETMAIVQMVLIGQTNKEIVARLGRRGARAVGLSGIDGRLLECEKVRTDLQGNPVDLGYVGQIVHVNTNILETLTVNGYIPVVAPIGVGADGERYNINADTAASEIAAALKAEKLMTLTDVPGVMLRDADGTDQVVSTLNETEIATLIERGEIKGGMIPKVLGCLDTVQRGVRRAHIIDGRVPHCLLLEMFTHKGIGTMITVEPPPSHHGEMI